MSNMCHGIVWGLTHINLTYIWNTIDILCHICVNSFSLVWFTLITDRPMTHTVWLIFKDMSYIFQPMEHPKKVHNGNDGRVWAVYGVRAALVSFDVLTGVWNASFWLRPVQLFFVRLSRHFLRRVFLGFWRPRFWMSRFCRRFFRGTLGYGVRRRLTTSDCRHGLGTDGKVLQIS